MKPTERGLIQTEREVVTAKRLLKEKRAEFAATRNRLKRENASRVMQTVGRALDNLRQHRHVLEELAAGRATKQKKPRGKRGVRRGRIRPRAKKKVVRTSKHKLR
jgi:hypothetical protein